MRHSITLLPGNQIFTHEGNISILDMALEKGLNISYGCRNGKCGRCKARLNTGKIKPIRHFDYVLSTAEKNQGYFLMCACTAVSDLLIEADLANSDKDIPLQTLNAKVKKVEHISDLTTILNVQTPRTKTLRFLAGQNIELSINGDKSRYPIASCPCDDRNLQFHINSQNGSKFSDYFLTKFKNGDTVKIKGPYGNFQLQENPSFAAIFIAIDNGFAPIKSLIEHAISLDIQTAMHLYLINTYSEKHFMHNLCRSWQDAIDNFYYHPVYFADTGKNVPYYDMSKTSLENLTKILFSQINNHVNQPEQYYYYLSGGKQTVNNLMTFISEQLHGQHIVMNYVPL